MSKKKLGLPFKLIGEIREIWDNEVNTLFEIMKQILNFDQLLWFPLKRKLGRESQCEVWEFLKKE